MEAAVFAQAANIDRLLSMLRKIDPAKDNLADNEEIQVNKTLLDLIKWISYLFTSCRSFIIKARLSGRGL